MLSEESLSTQAAAAQNDKSLDLGIIFLEMVEAEAEEGPLLSCWDTTFTIFRLCRD